MILPKPTMLVMPTYGSANGGSFGACNSSNRCDDQTCDNGHTEGNTVWEVVKESVTTLIEMFTMIKLFG